MSPLNDNIRAVRAEALRSLPGGKASSEITEASQ